MISALLKPAVIVNGKKYKVMKQIGEGGFAFVYDVMCTTDRQHYALKKMICQTDEQLDEAKKEIETMEKVKHVNVLPLLEFAYTINKRNQKEVLLVLPLCQSGSVQTVIDKGPGHPHCAFTDGLDVLKIIRQVVEGLSAIHACGLRHADLKPANILLSESYQAVITDFGSVSPAPVTVSNRAEALEIQEKAASFTTASYRAPELFNTPSECVIGCETDVWSLGCLIYCMFYSRSPFESTTEGLSTLAVISAHYTIPDSNLWPEEYLALIAGCLTADPQKRSSLSAIQTSLLSIPCPPLNLRPPSPPPAAPAASSVGASPPPQPVDSAARGLSLSRPPPAPVLGQSACSTPSTSSSAVTTGQIAFSATTASEQGSFPPTPSTGGRVLLTAEDANFAHFPPPDATKDGASSAESEGHSAHFSNRVDRSLSKDQFGSYGSALSGLVFDDHNFEGSVFNSSVADSYVIAENETLSNISTGNNSPAHPHGAPHSASSNSSNSGRVSFSGHPPHHHGSGHHQLYKSDGSSEGCDLTEPHLRRAHFIAPPSLVDPSATVASLVGASGAASDACSDGFVVTTPIAAHSATSVASTSGIAAASAFPEPSDDGFATDDDEFGEFTTGTTAATADDHDGVIGIANVSGLTDAGVGFDASTKGLNATTMAPQGAPPQVNAAVDALPVLDLWSLIVEQSQTAAGVVKEGPVYMMRQGGFPKRWAKKPVRLCWRHVRGYSDSSVQ